MPLSESTSRGIGGKGTSGGLVLGGVTRRRGDTDRGRYLEYGTDSSEEDVGSGLGKDGELRSGSRE